MAKERRNKMGGNGEAFRGGYSSEQIAARAYELYLARGAADGQDFDDWIAAERELATRSSGADEHRTQPAAGERSE